ncbi:MAG TPA: ion transporter [Gemmatimonadaceae bacterium]|nr:ion transporter [Gemmatimonadaceae bacterium]
MSATDAQRLHRERWRLLRQLHSWVERPMFVLAFVWLALFVIEVLYQLSPAQRFLGTLIWALFVADFALELTIAPAKLRYLKTNWLTALALLVPALRLFRFARALRFLRVARASRSLRLLRIVSSLNRGMRALSRSMSRRGFGYVLALTLIVLVAGAAGMFAFERDAGVLTNFSTALWWTAMILTTMGSDYWPQTGEGRILCVLLALYAFAVFGYVTAALASFFIGRDADAGTHDPCDPRVAALQAGITLLSQQLAALVREHDS